MLDTEGERVRVKFDMDREQDEESAYWYPWRPDMGNLMYCMPEKGERVVRILRQTPVLRLSDQTCSSSAPVSAVRL